MAVVATLEFDDLAAAGDSARQTDSRHRCLGAGADQADFFNGWHACRNGFRNLDLGLGRGAERQTVHRGFLHGAYDLWVRDGKSVVSGKGGSGRVNLGVRRTLKTKKNTSR